MINTFKKVGKTILCLNHLLIKKYFFSKNGKIGSGDQRIPFPTENVSPWWVSHRSDRGLNTRGQQPQYRSSAFFHITPALQPNLDSLNTDTLRRRPSLPVTVLPYWYVSFNFTHFHSFVLICGFSRVFTLDFTVLFFGFLGLCSSNDFLLFFFFL